jgi:hypothetical protein
LLLCVLWVVWASGLVVFLGCDKSVC